MILYPSTPSENYSLIKINPKQSNSSSYLLRISIASFEFTRMWQKLRIILWIIIHLYKY